MAQNYIQPGKVLSFTVPAGGWQSGQAVAIGQLVGVALGSYAEGEQGEVAVTGVYRLAKAALPISFGDKLYLDTANHQLTTQAEGHVFAGYAANFAPAIGATIDLLLRG